MTSLMHNPPARLVALASAIVLIVSAGCTSSGQQLPEGTTTWAPVGPRTVGTYEYDIIPQPNAFHTMHAGPNNFS